MTEARQVMDAKQVADYLGVSPSTIYKWVEQRSIPFTKVGNLLRFPRWLIDQWLTEKATRPQHELYQRFVRLQQRYHLEQFLAARGLDVPSLTREQVLSELEFALEELEKTRERDEEE